MNIQLCCNKETSRLSRVRIETNYRLEMTVQDVLAMYMHIYWQGLHHVQSFYYEKRKCHRLVPGNIWLNVLFTASRCSFRCTQTIDLLRCSISCWSPHKKHSIGVRDQPNCYPTESSINARASTVSLRRPPICPSSSSSLHVLPFQGNSNDLHKIVLKWSDWLVGDGHPRLNIWTMGIDSTICAQSQLTIFPEIQLSRLWS